MRYSTNSSGDDAASPVDGGFEHLARGLAQRTPRRSFLGKAGTVLLALAGAATLDPVLPWDRRISTVAAQGECGAWQYCGMHGHPCSGCGGSDSSCPGGCTEGSSWTYCCTYPGTSCTYYYTYRDCCGSCSSCSNSFCHGSDESDWCGTAGSYKCTLAVYGGLCSGTGCPFRPAA